MKNLKRLFLLSVILSGIAIEIFISNRVFAENALRAELVRIMPELKGDEVTGFYVDPPISYIRKNTIILWINGIPEEEVQIVFQDSKTCRDISVNPNLNAPGFFLNASNCYVTSFLPYSNASALQFIDIGNYEYEVMTMDGKMTTKGKISVR